MYTNHRNRGSPLVPGHRGQGKSSKIDVGKRVTLTSPSFILATRNETRPHDVGDIFLLGHLKCWAHYKPFVTNMCSTYIVVRG
jgi:hypothetical protein